MLRSCEACDTDCCFSSTIQIASHGPRGWQVVAYPWCCSVCFPTGWPSPMFTPYPLMLSATSQSSARSACRQPPFFCFFRNHIARCGTAPLARPPPTTPASVRLAWRSPRGSGLTAGALRPRTCRASTQCMSSAQSQVRGTVGCHGDHRATSSALHHVQQVAPGKAHSAAVRFTMPRCVACRALATVRQDEVRTQVRNHLRDSGHHHLDAASIASYTAAVAIEYDPDATPFERGRERAEHHSATSSLHMLRG